MNGRVVEFAMHTHHEAQRLLPWLANDTLEAGEREWVQRHLEGCAECRAGLREQRALRAAVLESGQPPADVGAGWRRMRSRLVDSHAVAPAGRGPWDPGRKRMPRWPGWAVAAQLLLAIGLGFAWWASRTPPTAYHTLSASPRPAGNLLVVFDPRISAAQMQRLLEASDARIVDGPTDAGAYVLSVPADRAEGVRDALRAAPGVTMVESLSAGPPR
jgi:hypothetical protein